jgi:hypothetical protein
MTWTGHLPSEDAEQGVVLPLVDDFEVTGEDLGVRGLAALLGDDDPVVALQAGRRGEPAAGAVADESTPSPIVAGGTVPSCFGRDRRRDAGRLVFPVGTPRRRSRPG